MLPTQDDASHEPQETFQLMTFSSSLSTSDQTQSSQNVGTSDSLSEIYGNTLEEVKS